MPVKGNSYIATLKKTHLGWGTYRKTTSRPAVPNEGFLPIPITVAVSLNITNIHNKKQSPIYTFSTNDGFIKDKLMLASGNRTKGDMYAKNFHGKGDLKLLGGWFKHIGAKVGDQIKVEFISSNEMLLTK